MKKIKYLLVLVLFAIVTTGCVKFNANMDIKKDKSMDFTVIYAFDKSMMGEMGTLKEEDFDDLKKEGYTVEKYSEGDFEGFKLIKKYSNIDEVSSDKDVEYNLSGMMDDKTDNKYMFKVVKEGSKSTYYAKFKFDSNDSGLSEDEDDDDNTNEGGQALPDVMEGTELEAPDENGTDFADEEMTTTTDGDDIDISKMMGNMDLSFTVNLPSKAISSNATTKENGDKKLTWKLNYTGSQTIEFAFEIDANAKDSNMLLYIGIGAGVLILIVAVVAIILSSKKKGATPAPVTMPVTNEEPAPIPEPVETPVEEEPKEENNE